jgi:hypothetical protein
MDKLDEAPCVVRESDARRSGSSNGAWLGTSSTYGRRVLIAKSCRFHHRGAELEVLYQRIQPASGVSFWLEKV